MNYQWDPEKAASNLGKHCLDCADAVGVFEDEWALTIADDYEYVEGEECHATAGTDFLGRALVVVNLPRSGDSIDIRADGDQKRKKSV